MYYNEKGGKGNTMFFVDGAAFGGILGFETGVCGVLQEVVGVVLIKEQRLLGLARNWELAKCCEK